MNKCNFKRIVCAIWRSAFFFALISFVVTCSMMLFLSAMSQAMAIELTKAQIHDAAIITFNNVILLSLLCTIVDSLRRKWMVERPVKRIVAAAEKIMSGDFKVQIAPIHSIGCMDDFDLIIGYINRMAKELSGIETLRADFIANVSHELKTPLAVIQNYGTLLSQPNLPEKQRQEYAKVITDASRRLTELISNILKLNKLENQQIYPEKQAFDLGEQICACLLAFEDIWEAKAIEIDTDLAEDVWITSDKELLSLVWNNLFSNALKFTPSGGRVSVKLMVESHYAIVQVSDNGCGISPEVGAHIFEKFYQGDTSHAAQGNGLGLALVKRVMDIVEGDISVNSEVGKGSCFEIKIRRMAHGAG